MSRRERLERKLEQRLQWAKGRTAKAAAAWSAGSDMAAAIPLGQPILVGHYSEGRDRRYRARIAGKFDAALEHEKAATSHRAAADGLEAALDRAIFDDDVDALERLAEKAAALRAIADARKAGGAVPAGPGGRRWSSAAARREALRCDKRAESIRARRAADAALEAAGGAAIEDRGNGYATFRSVEYPGRDVVAALKAAGYSWFKGYWYGVAEKMPEAARAYVAKRAGGAS
jgi:hypothetical protein